jgi:hypothetical protein
VLDDDDSVPDLLDRRFRILSAAESTANVMINVGTGASDFLNWMLCTSHALIEETAF